MKKRTLNRKSATTRTRPLRKKKTLKKSSKTLKNTPPRYPIRLEKTTPPRFLSNNSPAKKMNRKKKKKTIEIESLKDFLTRIKMQEYYGVMSRDFKMKDLMSGSVDNKKMKKYVTRKLHRFLILEEVRKLLREGKNKRLKLKPFEKFSSKESRKQLEKYKTRKEDIKGQIKSEKEIEKEEKLSILQSYEDGVEWIKRKEYGKAFEVLQKGFYFLENTMESFETSKSYRVFLENEEKEKNIQSVRKIKKTTRRSQVRRKVNIKEDEEREYIIKRIKFFKSLKLKICEELSSICLLLKYYKDSILYGKKVLALSPLNLEIYCIVADSYFHEENFLESSEYYEKLLLFYTEDDFNKDEDLTDKKKYIRTLKNISFCKIEVDKFEDSVKYCTQLFEFLMNDMIFYEKKLKSMSKRKIKLSNKKKDGKPTIYLYKYIYDDKDEEENDEVKSFANEEEYYLFLIEKIKREISKVLYNRARSYEKINENDKSKKDYHQILDFSQEFLTGFVRNAEELVERDNFEEGLNIYREILKIERDENLLFKYSLIVSELVVIVSKDYDNAIYHITKSIKYYGRLKQNKEKIENLDSLDKYSFLNVSEGELYKRRGLYYETIDEIQKAIVDFSTALESEKDSYEVYKLRGHLLQKEGRIMEAKDDFERFIVEAGSNSKESLHSNENLGIFEFLSDMYTKSKKFDKLLEIYSYIMRSGGFRDEEFTKVNKNKVMLNMVKMYFIQEEEKKLMKLEKEMLEREKEKLEKEKEKEKNLGENMEVSNRKRKVSKKSSGKPKKEKVDNHDEGIPHTPSLLKLVIDHYYELVVDQKNEEPYDEKLHQFREKWSTLYEKVEKEEIVSSRKKGRKKRKETKSNKN